MKIKIVAVISGVIFSVSTPIHSTGQNLEGLYASWCLTGMSEELNGEKVPDKATYTFTRDSKIKYDAGFFKQEDNFTIAGDSLKTKSMGNYKVISIKASEMILKYGGYMYFTKGACK